MHAQWNGEGGGVASVGGKKGRQTGRQTGRQETNPQPRQSGNIKHDNCSVLTMKVVLLLFIILIEHFVGAVLVCLPALGSADETSQFRTSSAYRRHHLGCEQARRHKDITSTMNQWQPSFGPLSHCQAHNPAGSCVVLLFSLSFLLNSGCGGTCTSRTFGDFPKSNQ